MRSRLPVSARVEAHSLTRRSMATGAPDSLLGEVSHSYLGLGGQIQRPRVGIWSRLDMELHSRLWSRLTLGSVHNVIKLS